jgi:uncharacterized protein (TIGR00162 family)
MTEHTIIKEIEKVELEDPILIEGLPGIGFVGQITADQMVKQLKATKFAELESDYFPPQVIVKDDGLIDHMKNEFYYVKNLGENNQDVVILTGNSQGSNFEGQIEISRVLIDFFEEINVKKIITLGGLGTGEMVENGKIFVAGNNKEFLEEALSIDNAQLRKDDGGGIVGASGLLLYYGEQKGIDAICLMGETPGFYIDPSAAKSMLLVLFDLLKFDMDLDEVNEKVEDTFKRLSNNPQFNQAMGMEPKINKPNDDLHYIG